MKSILPAILTFVALSASSQVYLEEAVGFQNNTIQLSGTLSFPHVKHEKYPVVILVSGSGPQNRDSEIFGFKPFKLLADFFNQEGYAVLRYDDRGVGQSTGKSVSESTTADLAEDARQAFLYLRSRKDIDPQNIGLLGHSEGGVVVPIVASKESVGFLILLAGFGVKGVDLSNAQQAAILRASGMSDEFVKASNTMNREVMRMMADETSSDDQIKEYVITETLKLLPLLPENIRSQIPDHNAYAALSAQQVLQQSKNTWIRYYMNYDPLPTLQQVKCPVLMLFGELDTQVLPSQNMDLMKSALTKAGNKQVQAKVISKANHLFQEAATGDPSEYASLKKEFVPELLQSIQKWLREK
jgi:pimeloyl-ACP methyl ester carboxylesterase